MHSKIQAMNDIEMNIHVIFIEASNITPVLETMLMAWFWQ